MFAGEFSETPEITCTTLLPTLPLVYTSIEEHHFPDSFCNEPRQKILNRQAAAEKFSIHKNLVCFFSKRAKRRRWIVPAIFRLMVITYFHDSPLAGHLGAHKTFLKTAANFWWPKMRDEIFWYVRQCNLCQRAKPAQDTRVGWHAAQPSTQPMEFFLDFVGPLTSTKRGNTGIVIVVDSFSKFVWFYPVRRISSQAVVDCLE
jgi:hypothetical protein